MMDESESLPEFLQRLWRSKAVLCVGALIGAAIGVFLILAIQPHYRAYMIVAPAIGQDVRDSLLKFEQGIQISRYYPLASPASPEFTRFEQTLREGTVAGILARYDGILGRIGEDRVFRFSPKKTVRPEGLPEYLVRHIQIDPVGVTSSRRITYDHSDPQFAAQLLRHVHKIADATIRHKAVAETEDRIAWLQKELAQAHNPDHRSALTELLLTQERRRMLASMDHSYAAEIVEPPVISPHPVWPGKMLVLLTSILAGTLGGFFMATLRQYRA